MPHSPFKAVQFRAGIQEKLHMQISLLWHIAETKLTAGICRKNPDPSCLGVLKHYTSARKSNTNITRKTTANRGANG